MEFVKSEVVHIQKQLEKFNGCKFGGDRVLDLLKALQELPVDGTVLTKTKITMTVNAVKKNSFDDQVVRLVNDLTKKWKKIMAESSSGKENTAPSVNSSSKKLEAVSRTRRDQERSASSHINTLAPISSSNKEVSVRKQIREMLCATVKVNGSRKTNQKRTSPPVKAAAPTLSSSIADSVRQKSREMLCAAIKGDGAPVDKAGDPQHLAQVLEECIYQEFRSADKKYASTIRSKIFNLRDAQNPQLRLDFLCGQITPQRLAKMTSTDMASVDLKAMREKWTKEAINEAQSGTIEGTKIDTL